MDKQKTLLRLSAQIKTIEAHIIRLKRDNYNIHALDVDMLLQKTREFYDSVIEMGLQVTTDDPKQNEKPTPIIEVEEEKPEDVSFEENENTITHEVNEEEAIETDSHEDKGAQSLFETDEIVEHKSEQTLEVEPQHEILEEEVATKTSDPVKETPKEEPKKEKVQTTYDLFSGSGDNSVIEKFNKSEEKSIADKIQDTQIKNIREAIGINEKFLFINELFGGDMGRYNKILDDINELSTKNGVQTYLQELKVQFRWNDNNEAFIKLKELLNRKF